VLGAAASGAFSLPEYQALGVQQSVDPVGELCIAIYQLFEKYRAWLKKGCSTSMASRPIR
jgi:hypothetical protein